MKQIIHNNKVLALILSQEKTDSIGFFTPTDYPIQIGLLQHKGNKVVPLHFHNNFHYPVRTTHEILYVEEGSMTLKITDFEWNEVACETLNKGDLVLLMDGGHSVAFSEDSRVWEFKQGPYPGDEAAKVFKDNWEGNIPEDRLCSHINN